jgi:hypothetical protein
MSNCECRMFIQFGIRHLEFNISHVDPWNRTRPCRSSGGRSTLELNPRESHKAPPTGIEPVSLRLTTERSNPAELWRRGQTELSKSTYLKLPIYDFRLTIEFFKSAIANRHSAIPSAEGGGFEPPSALSHGSALALRRDRPLCQPSRTSAEGERFELPGHFRAVPVFETGALPVRLTLRSRSHLMSHRYSFRSPFNAALRLAALAQDRPPGLP